MRVILLSGKGGVGKTSLAAATALGAARFGHRVALLSSDPAHSLGDALECRVGPELLEVAPGVDAQEVAVLSELERSWEAIHAWLVPLLLAEGGIAAEEILVLPGLEELVALRAIESVARGQSHDVCVVDCAPTAATLRMLRLPEVLDLLMERFWTWKRRAARALRVLATPVGAGRLIAPEEVFEAFESLVAEVGAVRALLLDADRTSARLVAQPARVVIEETRRAWSYLSLYGIATDALLVNRVLPDQARGPAFARWRERESRALAELDESFDLPALRVPLWSREPRGIADLTTLGEQLYGESDPAEQRSRPESLRFDSIPGGTRLSLPLPHASATGLDVERQGEALEIRWGLARRRIALPDSLAASEIESAELDAGRLIITFAALGDS